MPSLKYAIETAAAATLALGLSAQDAPARPQQDIFIPLPPTAQNAPEMETDAREDDAGVEAYQQEFNDRFCSVMEMATPEDGTVFSIEQRPEGGIYAVRPAVSFMADATIVVQPSDTAPRLTIIWPQNELQKDIALKPGEITDFDGNGRDAWGTPLACQADLQTPGEISVSCTGAYPVQTDKVTLTKDSATISTIYEIAVAGQQTTIVQCDYEHPLPNTGQTVNFNLKDQSLLP